MGGQSSFVKRVNILCFDTMQKNGLSTVKLKLIVGLGNPGTKFAHTRHNIGFQVIDLLAEKLNITVKRRRFGARLGEGEFANKKLILLKPWQFMNRSGQAVAKAMDFYNLDTSDLLVITDCSALDVGRIRIRPKGSAGGHKGLADIIEKLGTNEFGRLRIGIGSPPVDTSSELPYKTGPMNLSDYVLDKPDPTQMPLLNQALERAKQAVLCWVEKGIEAAMNEFNNTSSLIVNGQDNQHNIPINLII